MARKKARRTNIPEEALIQARRELSGQTGKKQPVQPKKKAKVETPTVSKTTVEDLAAEYAYVITDLRNMGILAAAAFALLIVMALVL